MRVREDALPQVLALHLQGLERECLLKMCASVERHLPHPSAALFKGIQGGSLRHEGLVCYGFLLARSLISLLCLCCCVLHWPSLCPQPQCLFPGFRVSEEAPAHQTPEGPAASLAPAQRSQALNCGPRLREVDSVGKCSVFLAWGGYSGRGKGCKFRLR